MLLLSKRSLLTGAVAFMASTAIRRVGPVKSAAPIHGEMRRIGNGLYVFQYTTLMDSVNYNAPDVYVSCKGWVT